MIKNLESYISMDMMSSKKRNSVAPIVNEEPEEHCHTGLKNEIDRGAERTLMLVTVLCTVFMIGEFIGGYLANSLAIMTDAAHLLTDFFSFIISLVAIWVSRRPATFRLTYGYHRAEVVGALTSIAAIWVLTAVLFYLAVQRVIHEDYEIDANTMLVTAACGVMINLIMAFVLFKSGHGHSHGGGGGHGHSHGGGGGHGHSHGKKSTAVAVSAPPDGHESDASVATMENGHIHGHENGALANGDSGGSRRSSIGAPRKASVNVPSSIAVPKKKEQNINVRAALIHVIGDLIQSIGIFVGAIVIKVKPEYKVADPICTFIFSVLVLFTTITVSRDIFRVLMEGCPKKFSYQEIRDDMMQIEGVIGVHDLRIWSLTLEKGVLTAHLTVAVPEDYTIAPRTTKMLRHKYHIDHSTLQIEPHLPGAMGQCAMCRGPSM